MNCAHWLLAVSLALTLAVSACTDRKADSGSGKAANSGAAELVSTDRWLGQWNGPEGTYLRLDGGKGKYEVTIRNLDGPRTFQGSGDGSLIRFERDGVKESIRASNGAETGMKWLADKSNCLTVRAGEGYCRN